MATYCIREGGSQAELVEKANEMLKQGWKLQGGVATWQYDEHDGYGNSWRSTYFIQAFVLEDGT